jgi:glycyl-tRNA synthetase beta chain
MAEWLFEIFSEEIPARMQRGAQAQLEELAKAHLQAQSLSFEAIRAFVTPRRLTLVVEGLPLNTLEKTEEKKGPRADAPQAAIDGFLKMVGLKREQCALKDTPKGEFLFAVMTEPSRPTQAILPLLATSLLNDFRWPKSMRWGTVSTPWVRPIRGLLSLFEGDIVPFSYAGVAASNTTCGHRFLTPGPFEVKNFKDYEKKLRDHYVILDWQERQALVQEGIMGIAQEANLSLVKDDALLEEVTGLVEWPVALKGAVDGQFMTLPPEVIITPMRVHQRYFPFLDPQGRLAPFFGVIANTVTRDGGGTIVRGNERVLRARLSDAQFFWEQDQKTPLEDFNSLLKTRLFHQYLGSLFDKVERLVRLSSHMATKLGETPTVVARAALLSKADLGSRMVGEFPELQGIMGRYYAQNQGEAPEVARAIEEHYWPKGAGGDIPEAMPSLILGIADRLDTLMGFFTIGITPTGSKDPYALRRAGLGLISLCLNPRFTLSMLDVLNWAYDTYPWSELSAPLVKSKEDAVKDLWRFLLERFKFFLKDKQGSPYDHVEAVLSIAHDNSNFPDLALRTQALDQLMGGEDGKNLLVAYKRASNILKIEEEKDGRSYEGTVVKETLLSFEEKNLFDNLEAKRPQIQLLVQTGDFIKAVQNLASLRPYVDQFFDQVVVNTEDANVRANRLHLLACVRNTLHYVADFSKLEG